MDDMHLQQYPQTDAIIGNKKDEWSKEEIVMLLSQVEQTSDWNEIAQAYRNKYTDLDCILKFI